MFGRKHDIEYTNNGTPSYKPFYSNRLFGSGVGNQKNDWSRAHTDLVSMPAADRKKYGVAGHPLQNETSLQHMQDHNYQIEAAVDEKLQEKMSRLLNGKDKDLPADLRIHAARDLAAQKVKDYREQLVAQHNETFIHDFRNFIAGVGKQSDYKKAGILDAIKKGHIGQARPLSNNPEVIEYLDAITTRVIDYEREIAKLKLRCASSGKHGGPNMHDCYLLYKYVVRGLPYEAKDFTHNYASTDPSSGIAGVNAPKPDDITTSGIKDLDKNDNFVKHPQAQAPASAKKEKVYYDQPPAPGKMSNVKPDRATTITSTNMDIQEPIDPVNDDGVPPPIDSLVVAVEDDTLKPGAGAKKDTPMSISANNTGLPKPMPAVNDDENIPDDYPDTAQVMKEFKQNMDTHQRFEDAEIGDAIHSNQEFQDRSSESENMKEYKDEIKEAHERRIADLKQRLEEVTKELEEREKKKPAHKRTPSMIPNDTTPKITSVNIRSELEEEAEKKKKAEEDKEKQDRVTKEEVTAALPKRHGDALKTSGGGGTERTATPPPATPPRRHGSTAAAPTLESVIKDTSDKEIEDYYAKKAKEAETQEKLDKQSRPLDYMNDYIYNQLKDIKDPKERTAKIEALRQERNTAEAIGGVWPPPTTKASPEPSAKMKELFALAEEERRKRPLDYSLDYVWDRVKDIKDKKTKEKIEASLIKERNNHEDAGVAWPPANTNNTPKPAAASPPKEPPKTAAPKQFKDELKGVFDPVKLAKILIPDNQTPGKVWDIHHILQTAQAFSFAGTKIDDVLIDMEKVRSGSATTYKEALSSYIKKSAYGVMLLTATVQDKASRDAIVQEAVKGIQSFSKQSLIQLMQQLAKETDKKGYRDSLLGYISKLLGVGRMY